MYIKIIYDDDEIGIVDKYDSCKIINNAYVLIKDGKNKMCIPLCKIYGIQKIDTEIG